jgi:diguanylate cyclase (GGDEF)-like protein
MTLDVPTALAIMTFAAAVAAALLATSWLQHRDVPALLPWALAFGLAAAGMLLGAGRVSLGAFWSVTIANALIALAYGCMWNGTRIFDGRSSRILAASAGALVWLAACTSGDFMSSPRVRLTLLVAIAMIYSLLTVGELWRSRQEGLASRWLIIGLLLGHTVALPFRLPLAGQMLEPQFDRLDLLTFVMLESVLLSMCGAYLFGSLASERIAYAYKRASLVDPLTGVANRRAFRKQGARIVHRCRLAGESIALVLFDLDHFKSVNDRFGHAVGDGVLVTFCRISEENLRPTDLFARLGGEEFACLLASATQEEAFAIAERVRAAFESARHKVGEGPLATTVSIGVAISEDGRAGLSRLMRDADDALYRAKQQGRNRVEIIVSAVLAPLID